MPSASGPVIIIFIRLLSAEEGPKEKRVASRSKMPNLANLLRRVDIFLAYSYVGAIDHRFSALKFLKPNSALIF